MGKNTKKKIGEDPNSIGLEDAQQERQHKESPQLNHFDGHVTNRSKSKKLPSH